MFSSSSFFINGSNACLFATIMKFLSKNCLEDEFWSNDCGCNVLSKYLPLVNNVVDFSFPIFNFDVNYSCLMLVIIVCRFKFGMLP